jgi:uncharacterized protein (TIGR02145 family)
MYLDPNADTTGTLHIQSQIAGGALKEVGDLQAGTGLWDPPNAGATNISGFTAIPGGRKLTTNYYNYFYTGLGNVASFWTTSQISSDAIARDLFYNGPYTNTGQYRKNTGFSVRCIKD